MVKKQKKKKENTKDNSSFDLDNEIIIGITPLEDNKPLKNKKSTTNARNKKIKDRDSINKKAKDKRQKTKKLADKKKKGNTKKIEDDDEKIPDELAIEIQGIKIKDEKNSKNIKNKKVNRKVKKNRQEDNKKDNKKNNKKSNKTVNKRKEEKLQRADQLVENDKNVKEADIAKQKRMSTFHIVKWTSLVIIIIATGIYFMLSPFFNIKEINVQGIERLTAEEVISLSRINLDENTFKIQASEVQKLIKQNAYVDNVYVKRRLPDKIEIQVIERKPTFMILFGNAYVYLNNQGYLLEVAKEPLEIPAIVGFVTPENEIHEGNRLCSEDLQRLDQVLQIMKSAESNGIKDLITKINIHDKQDYILELKSEKKTVHIGNTTNLSTKMLYVDSILNENKGVEGEIFVNTDLNNKGAIFRKKI